MSGTEDNKCARCGQHVTGTHGRPEFPHLICAEGTDEVSMRRHEDEARALGNKQVKGERMVAVIHIAIHDLYADDIEEMVKTWQEEGEDEVTARTLVAGEALTLARPDCTATFWLHGGEKSTSWEEELRCMPGKVVGIEAMPAGEASVREASAP